MEYTVGLPGEISSEESPTKGYCMEVSLRAVKQCMAANKELRSIIKGALDPDYIDKYIEFSENMECILAAVEELINEFDAT